MRILFVCMENAGRSQMAEAFARKRAPAGVEVYSAGSRPAQELHPATVEVMQEAGIDLAGARPKGMGALPDGVFDWVIGMGCGDARLAGEGPAGGQACPAGRAKRTLSWDISNPKDQPIEVVRQIRDQIKRKVQDLLKERGEPVSKRHLEERSDERSRF